MRHLIFLSTLVAFAFPVLASAQADPKLQVPDTLDEAKQGVLNIGDKILGAIPGVVSGIWKNEVVPVWKAMWNWLEEEVWQRRVKPALETVWDKVMKFLGQEVEKRKPLIEQELEEEKQELKEDIRKTLPDVKKGLWERFQGLFGDE